MKKMLLFLAVISAVATSTALGEVGISTGAKVGTYYAVANEIKGVCAGLDIEVYESNGSLSNIERVFADSRVQYGIVQQDALEYMKVINPTKMKKIKMVFPLYDEEIHLLARIDSRINSLADLRGKKVNIGKENSGVWITSQIIKSKTGASWKESTLDPKEAVRMVMSGELDAMFYVAGKPIAVLKDLGKSGEDVVKLVSIRHQELAGFYIPTSIPEGLYAFQQEAVQTYGVKSVLATFAYNSPKRKEEIASLVSCIVKNLDGLQMSGHPKWKEVDPLDFNKVQWPIHKTAKKTILKLKKIQEKEEKDDEDE